MSDDQGSGKAESAAVGPKPGADAAQRAAAQRVISLFGGIRPMSSKLGVAVSTVQGWRERGSIPANRHEQIFAAAQEHGVDLDHEELVASDRGAAPDEAGPWREAASSQEPATAKPVQPAGKAKPRVEPATEPPPRPAKLRSKRRGGWLLFGFLLGVVVLGSGAGGAVYTRALWLPLIDPGYGLADDSLLAMGQRISELESAGADGAAATDTAALEALGARIAGLEARPGGAETNAAAIAEIEERLDALAAAPDGAVQDEEIAALAARLARLESLQARLGEIALFEDRLAALEGLDARVDSLAALEARVETLAESQAVAGSALAGETALMLAVLQLRDALRGAGPFAAELGMLRKLAESGALADGGALAQLTAPLSPHAARGVPTPAMLKAQFPPLARAVVAQAQGGEGEDWVSGMLRRAAGLVTIRPVGPVEGDSPGAIVARAEMQLMSDNPAAALAELDALSGPAAETLRAWRAGAQARLDAQRVLTGLGELLIARLEPAGG